MTLRTTVKTFDLRSARIPQLYHSVLQAEERNRYGFDAVPSLLGILSRADNKICSLQEQEEQGSRETNRASDFATKENVAKENQSSGIAFCYNYASGVAIYTLPPELKFLQLFGIQHSLIDGTTKKEETFHLR